MKVVQRYIYKGTKDYDVNMSLNYETPNRYSTQCHDILFHIIITNCCTTAIPLFSFSTISRMKINLDNSFSKSIVSPRPRKY